MSDAMPGHKTETETNSFPALCQGKLYGKFMKHKVRA